jgi:DNA-directed RNA polymerase specialized sigma subunit
MDDDGHSLGLEPELARALSVLSGREREILALRYGADLRSPDIAAVMGLTVANVQQITSRALRSLRGALEPAKSAHRQRTELWSDESTAVLE